MAFNFVGMPANALNFRKRNKRTGQIKARTRGMPITQQQIVTLNCFFDSDQKNRDQSNKDVVAPYTEDPSVYTAQRGEWALARINNLCFRDYRTTTEEMSDVYAFTCVNGLRRSDRVVALGMVLNGSMNHSGDELKDSYGVVQIAGTCTGFNTGPETIHAMSHVFLLAEPYTVVDEYGNDIPGIDMTAMTIPATKMYAQTVALTSGSVTVQMSWLKNRLQKLLDERSQGQSFVDAHDVQKLVRGRIKESHIVPEMPLFTWAELWFALHFVERKRFNPADDELSKVAIPYALQVINDVYAKNDQWKFKFLRSLGDDLLPKSAPRFVYDDYIKGGNQYESFFKEIIPRLYDALIKTQALQHDWLDMHYLGLATTNSTPGGPLDIMLRASRS